MGDTDKMCVYKGYNKARDCRVETLVKHEAHRYLSTSEWINAAPSPQEPSSLKTELTEQENQDLKTETLIKDKIEMLLKTDPETFLMMMMFK